MEAQLAADVSTRLETRVDAAADVDEYATPPVKHSATSAGAHAGAESMLTVPATVIWLKCALHDVLFRTFRVTSGGKYVPWWTLPVD